MEKFQQAECFTFEGFTNRVNCLASAKLRWPKGFALRWIINNHCPVSFGELFSPFEGVRVTSGQGSWHEYGYADEADRLCHYFLTTERSRVAVKRIYQEIISHCRVPAVKVDGFEEQSIALHYRRFIPWEKATIPVCVEMVTTLAERIGVASVILSSDDRESAVKLTEALTRNGLQVAVLGAGLDMTSDLDRDRQRVWEFVGIWRTLTQSRWAVSNAIASTVLDASRALGNEVWTFGDVSARTGHRCALFNRFRFDWLVAGPLVDPIGFDFSKKCGPKIIAYSLFGEEPRYRAGMIRNINEARIIYPGWQVVVFVDESIDDAFSAELKNYGAIVYRLEIRIPTVAHRFLPAIDCGVEFLLVRDADSSLTKREQIAVNLWMKSGRSLHVMRDHIHHDAAIMAGMWGCRGGFSESLGADLQQFEFSGSYGEDQDFLAERVWKKFSADALVHDTFGSFDGKVFPFPEACEDGRFVGQRLDENGNDFDFLRS